jgi:hypothetical protein
VLGVTALGPDLGGAREHAYTTVDRIAWPAGFWRRDIAAPRSIRSSTGRYCENRALGPHGGRNRFSKELTLGRGAQQFPTRPNRELQGKDDQ